MLERERLGSTGFGRGIALPHAKMADLGGVRGLFGGSWRGSTDFTAVDGLPVDLLSHPAVAGSMPAPII